MPSLVSFQPPNTAYIVRCAHTVNYFSKGIDNEGPYYKVEYLIDSYVNTDLFVNALLGYVSLTGGTSGQVVKRAPHQHPLSPNLFCKTADVVEGLGGPATNASGFPGYNGGAVIRCEYRPWTSQAPEMTANELAQQIDPTTPLLWCTQELEFTTETITLPSRKLIWGDTMKPAGVPFPVEVGITILLLTWHRVPYMPATVIRSLRGKTNVATFLGASPGTVLFKGAKVTREADTSGLVVQKLVQTYKERDNDWSTLLRGDDMAWVPIISQTGSLPPYTQADLSPLLNF